MHYICGVEYDSGYKLRVAFEDGSVRIVDLEGHLDGEIFEPLKDVRIFKTARLNPDIDTVVWQNGADMSPDFLYETGLPIQTSRREVLRVAEGKVDYPTKRGTSGKKNVSSRNASGANR